jgi:transposase
MAEVPMIEPDSVRQVKDLHRQGWGTKRIARELGLARNTVKRYLRLGAAAERQERPAARCLDAEGVALAVKLFDTEAQGNAVVLTELLHARGYDVGLRTVQQTVQHRRRELRAQELATVRYETSLRRSRRSHGLATSTC